MDLKFAMDCVFYSCGMVLLVAFTLFVLTLLCVSAKKVITGDSEWLE